MKEQVVKRIAFPLPATPGSKGAPAKTHIESPEDTLVTTSFRASAAQRDRWREAARAHGLRTSEWIRRALDDRPIPPPPTPLDQAQSVALSRLGRVAYQLAKLGSNLNQLTRMAHEGQNVTEQVLPLLQHLSTEVERIDRLLRAMRESGSLLPTSLPEEEVD